MSRRTTVAAIVIGVLMILVDVVATACAVDTTATTPAPAPTVVTSSATSSTTPSASTATTVIAATTTDSATTAPAPPACTETMGHIDRLTFQSTVLAVNQPVQHYRVYTPRCYATQPTVRYPIVYLLHGAQTDDSQWEAVGVFTTADRLIAAGTIAPMIIVLPDGIWAMGNYDGNPTGFDRFLRGEMIPTVEHVYRVIDDPAHRALGGISRGGEWALLEGARHPELFGTIGGHSPAVGAPGSPDAVLVPLLQGNPGQRVWLDVGTSDSLAAPVSSLDAALRDAGLTPEYHTSVGAHDRTYWSSMTESYLRFYSARW